MTSPLNRDLAPPPGQQCTSTAKSTGERCTSTAIVGGYVCDKHGGRARQVREAANRRLMRSELDGKLTWTLGELEVEAAGRGPTEVLLDAVARAHAMVQVMGAMVADLAPEDMTRTDRYDRVHPAVWLVEYDKWLTTAAKASKLALDAGVAERLVQVEQEKARLIVDVFRQVFEDPLLGLSEDQKRAAGQLAGRALRALPAG
jgi:hypothetical protein